MKKQQALIKKVDTELTKLNDEYVALHADLDKHRGKPLEDTDLDEVNKLIRKIEDKYEEIYQICWFIANRYEYSCNISKSHEMFISQLIQTGAQEVENERH